MDEERVFSFGEAITLLKSGKFVARRGWNGQGMWLGLQNPDEHSANRAPYIWIMPVGGARVPWCPSHADMLREDWVEVKIGGVPAQRMPFESLFGLPKKDRLKVRFIKWLIRELEQSDASQGTPDSGVPE